MSGQLDREEFKALHADLVKQKMTTLDVGSCFEELDRDQSGCAAFSLFHTFPHSLSMTVTLITTQVPFHSTSTWTGSPLPTFPDARFCSRHVDNVKESVWTSLEHKLFHPTQRRVVPAEGENGLAGNA